MREDIQAELLAAEAALASRSLVDLGLYINRRDRWKPESTVFEVYPHVRILDNLIRRFLADPVKKYLLLAAPPRHSKSWMVSRTLPLWHLINRPDEHVILSGYGASFASTWGRATRDMVTDFPEFGLAVDPSARSVEHFALARPHRGTATFTGIGGSITGRGAHLFVIDDAIKNAEEALSEAYCRKLKEWFDSTARTRLEPGGKMVVMQTVWSYRDLYSQLAKDLDERLVTRIEMPAIANGNIWDPTGRDEGEALCPERYPVEELEDIKAGIDPWAWNAMYMCQPQADEGGLFSKAGRRTYTTTPNHYVLQQPDAPALYVDKAKVRRFVTADLAASTKTQANYTVFSVWDACLLPDSRISSILLAACVRSRIDSADHLEQALDVYRRFKPLFLGVEKATYGLTLVTQLQRAGVPVRELLPDKDKVSRALPASSAWNAGRVYLPAAEEMALVEDLAREALEFPQGKNDDFVDTLSYAVQELDLGPIGPSLGAFRPRDKGPKPGSADEFLARRRKPQRVHQRAVGL